jgi:peptidoglycan/LPS O-acetylase OafA/YrhL
LGIAKKAQRFEQLEGLRGVAAIVVVLYHVITMFYPNMALGPRIVQHMRLEDNLYGNPLNVFLSGGFAVGIFFVLSGFVLSIGFFQSGKESIVKKLASKRYLRLMVPALASVLLSFLLLSLHFNANRDASVAITQSGTIGEWSFPLNIFDALKQATYGIFFESVKYYNPVLWTMTFEFIGSFIVFLCLFLFGKSNYRWMVYGALAMATFCTWYEGIILGMVIADLYAHKKLSFLNNNRIAAGGVLLLGLFIGGYPFGDPAGTVYSFITLPWVDESANITIFISLGAVLVTMGILSFAPASRFFALPRVSKLGKYTYSLYLTHTLILLTLTTTLFMFFIHSMGYNKSVALSFLISLPVIAVVTWLFERYVDAPSIKFANYFSDIHLKDSEVEMANQLKQYVSNLKNKPMPEVDELSAE